MSKKKRPLVGRELMVEELTQRIERSVNRGHYVSEAAALGVLWFLEDRKLLVEDWRDKINEPKEY